MSHSFAPSVNLQQEHDPAIGTTAHAPMHGSQKAAQRVPAPSGADMIAKLNTPGGFLLSNLEPHIQSGSSDGTDLVHKNSSVQVGAACYRQSDAYRVRKQISRDTWLHLSLMERPMILL